MNRLIGQCGRTQACYALGYNLAIEYMASYEKPWMLDAFRQLNREVLAPSGCGLQEWLFLEVRLCPHRPPTPHATRYLDNKCVGVITRACVSHVRMSNRNPVRVVRPPKVCLSRVLQSEPHSGCGGVSAE